MNDQLPDIQIPSDLLPSDGRFGSGPSRVRPEAVASLAAEADHLMGTSHRREPIRALVGRLRHGLGTLFGLPDGWEVVLGNGGATVFWDVLSFSFIERRSQHLAFGEFSSKFAKATAGTPHLADPEIIEAPPGTHPLPEPSNVDAYALTHNETSTGVAMALERPKEVPVAEGLVMVDATSAAGGLRWNPGEVDVYYFAPQKCFGADGGLWIACCSPAAIDRIERITRSERWIPPSLDLGTALDNSRKNQTYNTPALATVYLTVQQIEWFSANGGLEWAATRCDQSAATIYGWADAHEVAVPFVTDPSIRSHVVATIDFDESVPADKIAAVLRANGVVDTESYRKLGRNQIRVALFPGIDPSDIRALCACVDHVIGSL